MATNLPGDLQSAEPPKGGKKVSAKEWGLIFLVAFMGYALLVFVAWNSYHPEDGHAMFKDVPASKLAPFAFGADGTTSLVYEYPERDNGESRPFKLVGHFNRLYEPDVVTIAWGDFEWEFLAETVRWDPVASNEAANIRFEVDDRKERVFCQGSDYTLARFLTLRPPGKYTPDPKGWRGTTTEAYWLGQLVPDHVKGIVITFPDTPEWRDAVSLK